MTAPTTTSASPQAGTPSVDAVMEVLNGIVDPCSSAQALPAGLVDMGLVHEAGVALDGGIRVVLRVTHGMCLVGGVFVNEARKRLATIPGATTVDVQLDATTVWTPEMMAPDYARRLVENRAARSRSRPGDRG